LLMLAAPLVVAIGVAALGSRNGDAIRWLSLAATVFSLVLALFVAVHFASEKAADPGALSGPTATFQPEMVPGATAADRHSPRCNVLPVGLGVVQFYIGIDCLNVWLVVLTALLMVSAVLVSWTAVNDRVNEYYAWLLALETGMLGVFLAFDVILFYVFF